MNREKFFRNLVIAIALVAVAGLVGQLRRVNTERKSSRAQFVRRAEAIRTFNDGKINQGAMHSDVLVRFRPSVSAAQIEALNDEL
jgi:hypothetical protein